MVHFLPMVFMRYICVQTLLNYQSVSMLNLQVTVRNPSVKYINHSNCASYYCT